MGRCYCLWSPVFDPYDASSPTKKARLSTRLFCWISTRLEYGELAELGEELVVLLEALFCLLEGFHCLLLSDCLDELTEAVLTQILGESLLCEGYCV